MDGKPRLLEIPTLFIHPRAELPLNTGAFVRVFRVLRG